MVDVSNAVLSNVNYTPVGVPDANITGPAFTGEQRDYTGVQYQRARYYNPAMGGWLSLDPFEGYRQQLSGFSFSPGS